MSVIRYQEKLPALISSRPDKHLTQPELVKLMEWKLTVRLSPFSSTNEHHTHSYHNHPVKYPTYIIRMVLFVSPEGEVQAEAAAAGGFQQWGNYSKMFQKGIQPPSWCAGCHRRAQHPERSWPCHCFRLFFLICAWIKQQLITLKSSILNNDTKGSLRGLGDWFLNKFTSCLKGIRQLSGPCPETFCILFIPAYSLVCGWLSVLFQRCWQLELQNWLRSCLMKLWRASPVWSPSSTQLNTMLCTWRKWLHSLQN